jgi:hypothetical protein
MKHEDFDEFGELLDTVAEQYSTRYRGYKSRDQKPEYPSHLIGIAKMHNATEGHKIDPPVLLDDKEKARNVLALDSGDVES